jgi:hypothetical protein
MRMPMILSLHTRFRPLSRIARTCVLPPCAQEVDEKDALLVLLKSVIDESLQAAAQLRPSAANVNNRFAAFIRELIANPDAY